MRASTLAWKLALAVLVAIAAGCQGAARSRAPTMNEPTIEVSVDLWIDHQPGADMDEVVQGSLRVSDSAHRGIGVLAVRLIFEGRATEALATPSGVPGVWSIRGGLRAAKGPVDIEIDYTLPPPPGEGGIEAPMSTARIERISVQAVE